MDHRLESIVQSNWERFKCPKLAVMSSASCLKSADSENALEELTVYRLFDGEWIPFTNKEFTDDNGATDLGGNVLGIHQHAGKDLGYGRQISIEGAFRYELGI